MIYTLLPTILYAASLVALSMPYMPQHTYTVDIALLTSLAFIILAEIIQVRQKLEEIDEEDV